MRSAIQYLSDKRVRYGDGRKSYYVRLKSPGEYIVSPPDGEDEYTVSASSFEEACDAISAGPPVALPPRTASSAAPTPSGGVCVSCGVLYGAPHMPQCRIAGRAARRGSVP